MSKPTLDAQSLFQAGRCLAPPIDRKELLRGRVLGLGAGVALGVGTASAVSIAKRLTLKASLLVVSSSLVVGAIWALSSWFSVQPPRRTVAGQGTALGSPVAERRPPLPVPPPAASADDASAALGRQAQPAVSERIANSPQLGVKPKALTPPVAQSDDWAIELDLLRQAQAALSRGNAKQALSLLDEHAARFPKSRLTPERRAARVFALCALGSSRAAEAHSQSVAFLADFPKSPLALRVETACKLESSR